MANSLNYEINIIPKGLPELNKVNDAVSSLAKSVNVSPFDSLMRVLTNIEKILTGIGKVGEQNFNRLTEISNNTAKNISKTSNEASNLNKELSKVGKNNTNGFMTGIAGLGQKLLTPVRYKKFSLNSKKINQHRKINIS